jgi:hypothetical protein
MARKRGQHSSLARARPEQQVCDVVGVGLQVLFLLRST